MKVTLASYVVGSTLLASAVIAHTYMTRGQFYLIAVNLVTSKGKLMALGNMGFVFAILFAKLLIKIFLGSLRDEEWENLNDRVSSTFIDTLLAMTIFREDFNASFVVLFVLLLSSKIFHWTVQDRVDYIERTPAQSRFTYLRVFTFIFFLALFDLSFVFYAFSVTRTKGPSVMLLFGFEYAVLFALSLQSMIKFFLNLEDLRREGRWDEKGALVLYLDFIIDMFKLIVYFLFFSFVMITYGMPFHIIRQMYMTFRSFKRRVRELLQYRRATSNMNQRFPDATPEEIANAHGVCIVCREEMTAAKKLPCSHVLHFHCLRSWLERSQTCPMCTASVLEERPQQAQPQPQPQAQPQQPQAPLPPHPFHNLPPFAFPQFPQPQHPLPQPQQPQPQQQQPSTQPQSQTQSQSQNQQPTAQGLGMAGMPPQMGPNAEFNPAMYNPLLHVEQIQQQMQMLQLETQLLWQYLYFQQNFVMNVNNFLNNPNNPTNDNNNNNNTVNTANSTNNSNNNNNNTTSGTSMTRVSSEELLNQVLQASKADQPTPASPIQSSSPSTSSETNTTTTSTPSSPPTSTQSTPSSPSVATAENDEDKDSLRRRRLLKFSSSE